MTRQHIINILCRINVRMDKDEMYKLPTLVVLMIASGILIGITNIFGMICGILILSLLSLIAMFRSQMLTGRFKIDLSIYHNIKVGDSIVFTSKCSAAGTSVRGVTRPIKKIQIEKNEEYQITYIEPYSSDWFIELVSIDNKNKVATIPLFPSRNLWKTKSEMRDIKLKTLLK